MENEQIVARIKAGIDKNENMLALYQQMKGLIYTIVKQYAGLAELDDLTQEGYLGLCAAVSHYDPDAGVKFSGYAGVCIKRHMQRYIHSDKLLSVSEQMRQLIYQYRRLCSTFQAEYGRKPTEQETAHHLQLKVKQVVRLQIASDMDYSAKSLDVSVSEEDELTLGDTLKGLEDTEQEVIERMQKEQIKAVLWEVVDKLPEKQPDIIRRRFQDNMTLQQIGDSMGMPRERVRQLENKGIRGLREPEYISRLIPLVEDYIAVHAYRGSGAETFRRTWTSSTERTAMGLLKCPRDKFGKI